MLKKVVSFLFLFVFIAKSHGQVIADAGSSKTLCYNTNTTLGGSPSAVGGTPPYTYDWQPSTFLNSNTISNPLASGCTQDIIYTLTVTDKNGNTSVSSVNINIDKIYTFNAGIDTGYCYGQKSGVTIGASQNNNSFHTFSWSPSTGLDNASSPNPFASPSVNTTYQLVVSDGICPSNVSQVTVTTFLPPYVDAGIDTTIDEGNTITLKGTGGVLFYWLPDYNIRYHLTATPDVWPTTTTTYTLYIEDSHKCYNSDTVRVNVTIGDKLFFYSAFTPNGDGDNDAFYIGNIEKYPDNNLKIYNRYGKLIFSATNYANTWDGKYLGNEVPTGTYYYIFDDGLEKKYKGSVTILR